MAARIIVFLYFHAFAWPVLADISLPRLLSDGMVLQRGKSLTIWGWADPGEPVTITLAGETAKATTGPDGTWRAVLPAMDAGGPYTLTLKGKNEIAIHDVLLGDVWFCSGQSNMVHTLNIHDVTYAKEISEADYPQVRQFLVPTAADLLAPQQEVSATGGAAAQWTPAIGEAVRSFAAVAYFFAKQLYDTTGIPIGIINASVGGTPIEAWTSEVGLALFPSVAGTVQRNKDTAYVHATNRAAAEANKSVPPEDRGMAEEPKWFEMDYLPTVGGWRTINVPGYWEDQGVRNLNGVVWYRKEVEIPESMVGRPARIFLGRIVDADELYINGQKIANTTYMYPQRRYHIADDVLQPGRNVFVVRVTNHQGKGGFVPDKPYCIFAGSDTVDLKGTWHYKVGSVFQPAPKDNLQPINIQYQPTTLFNAMVAPITTYAVKGVLWYQGESNVAQPDAYTDRMRALIADWRNRWGNEALPFLYVQLPGFMEYDYLPSESKWAELREAQRKVLAVPHTGMAVAIDLGEWNDIHPERKREVGERLALLAEKMVYKRDVVAHGPMYRSYRKEGNRVILSFDGVGSGLKAIDGGPLAEFAVAGADREFKWAKAEISGDNVAVWSDAIPDPVYVRYAWADNPVNPNLYNKEGLPASPFELVIHAVAVTEDR